MKAIKITAVSHSILLLGLSVFLSACDTMGYSPEDTAYDSYNQKPAHIITSSKPAVKNSTQIKKTGAVNVVEHEGVSTAVVAPKTDTTNTVPLDSPMVSTTAPSAH